MKNTENVR